MKALFDGSPVIRPCPLVRTHAAAWICLTLLPPLAVGCHSDTPRPASIDAIVAPFLGPNQGGVAIAVIQDGEVRVRQGFGLADIERRQPITPRTVFDLASLGKQFTGMAVLLLAKRGQLSLSDDVRRYVPELPIFDSRRPIRIIDLAQHKSGLPEFPGGSELPSESGVLTWLQRQTTLEFPTGTRWQYRNLNYFVLARVVERASGEGLREFLEQEIFAPAGMSDAQVLDSPDGIIRNRATGYCFGKPCRSDDGLTGPGGVFASVEDLIAWDKALSRDTFVRSEELVTAVGDGYAFGWRIVTHNGHRAIEHDGDAIGTRTYLVRYLDVPLTIILLSNQTRFEVETLEHQLVAHLLKT